MSPSSFCAPGAKNRQIHDQSGQGMVEYILLLAVILSVFLAVAKGLDKIGIVRRMMEPLNKDFANMYQYGHPMGERYPAAKHPRKRIYIEVKQ